MVSILLRAVLRLVAACGGRTHDERLSTVLVNTRRRWGRPRDSRTLCQRNGFDMPARQNSHLHCGIREFFIVLMSKIEILIVVM